MSKVFWLDLETTGLDPRANAICQFAGLVELDGEIVEELYVPAIRPFPTDRIDAKALEVNGLTREELEDGENPKNVHSWLCERLGCYVDKYNKVDKFVLAGYNIAAFDGQFLRAFFSKVDDRYFGSWFHSVSLDVMSFLAESLISGAVPCMRDNKLGTLCEELGIELKAHNALEDVRATRKAYQILRGELR